ncbi:hypothetical protein U1701_18145 [Sphingomonas sp. PB2P19]|uniref:hypothetical protein n=1 Tax=Sphingomonas rhamnosi TaxID=3096156 RepID=UPI002FC751BB
MVRNDRSASLANAIIDFRRKRAQVLPPVIFGEPVWELLLELYVADAEGVRLTGKDVTERYKVSVGVFSRWLRFAAQQGLIIGDGAGNIADQLTLSGDGMARMESLLSGASDVRMMLEVD